MKFADAFWYRYISFDPIKVGSARVVKNTIFGMGVESDSARFFVWFANTNEKVFVEYDDIQKLDASSRPYRGKVNGESVPSGVTSKELLAVQGSKNSSLMTPTKPNNVRSNVKEKSPEVPDQRPADVLREMVKSYPFVYGLPLRPYDSNFVIDEPHMYLTKGEWYSLGNDHPDSTCRHGVVCYAKRLGMDDAKAFDMYPLTSNTFSKTHWETTIEDWLGTMVNEAETRIIDQFGDVTSRSIREYTEEWRRSQMFMVKHDLSKNHKDWVASYAVSQSKWDAMNEIFTAINKGDIEELLNELATSIVDLDTVKSVEASIVDYLKSDDANMTLERLDEWMDILRYPSKRKNVAKNHSLYVASRDEEDDERFDKFELWEDALWEVKPHRIKKPLADWIAERDLSKSLAPAKVEGQNSLPNRPVIAEWKTPFPLDIKMTNVVIETGGGGVRPCTDQRIIDLMSEIMPILGNRVPMKLHFLTWGIGQSTSMITYLGKAKQILSVNPDQIKQIYGRCDLDTLGSAITHEMAHYVMRQIMKNSDLMRFKREVASINLHSSQNNAAGSTYPFYHEQFAMLCEYGVWNTCARQLQSTRGWEIANKYFNVTQHITPDITKKYEI